MDQYILQLKQETPIEKNQYFSKLIKGKMTFETFQRSQLDFYDAVIFFTKPMFVIASKLNSYQQRLIILNNIMDEHGDGELTETHGETFKKYLFSLGILKKEIIHRKQNKAAIVFNNSLEKKAKEESTCFSLAMMGIIEDRYTAITKILSEQLLKNHWLDQNTLTHYKVHEELDVEHAESFYKLIRNHWENIEKRTKIKEGLVFGNDLILNLYSKLL